MIRRIAVVTLIVTGLGLVAMAGERREHNKEDARRWDDLKRTDWKHHKGSATAVPEPGSLLLLGTGLLAGWQGLKRITRTS